MKFFSYFQIPATKNSHLKHVFHLPLVSKKVDLFSATTCHWINLRKTWISTTLTLQTTPVRKYTVNDQTSTNCWMDPQPKKYIHQRKFFFENNETKEKLKKHFFLNNPQIWKKWHQPWTIQLRQKFHLKIFVHPLGLFIATQNELQIEKYDFQTNIKKSLLLGRSSPSKNVFSKIFANIFFHLCTVVDK